MRHSGNHWKRSEGSGKQRDELPVTCATNSPNSARTVKLSMNPAVKLESGGTIAGGRGRRKTRSSLMIPPLVHAVRI